MFSHLTDLLSFDTTGNPASPRSDTQGGTFSEEEEIDSPSSFASAPPMAVAPEMEEPMEEVALEVTRSGGLIEPPPHGANSLDDDDNSSGAVVEGSKKRGLFSSFSKSKSTDQEVDEAVPVKASNRSKATDIESDDSDYAGGKVVGIAAVPEKEPRVSTYRYKKETNKKAWLICIAVLVIIAAIVVPTAILVPRNREDKSVAAASGTDGGSDGGTESGTGDETGGDTTETTSPPTAAPTTTPATLPQECEPVYDTLGKLMSCWTASII